MSKPSLQLSVTRLALSAIVQALGMQALGTVGTPLGVGQDMRNIGKGLEPGVGRHGSCRAYRRAKKPKHVTQVISIDRGVFGPARTAWTLYVQAKSALKPKAD